MILHKAVIAGDMDAVKSIIEEKKIDPNEEDSNGVTALIEAVLHGFTPIVLYLLDVAQCPAQPQKPFRHTPLRAATVTGRCDLIPILLAQGADPNAKSDGDRTPLMGACFLRGSVEGDQAEVSAKLVETLLEDKRTNPCCVNTFGESALDLARIRGFDKSMRLLEEAEKNWKTC